MGTTNGVTRGQLRPHFAGRNPPFLVAALCVGIAILAVSYWSLCSQYNDLELQLKNALQRRESIENSEIGVKKQLLVREDEFSKLRVDYQRKEQELSDLTSSLKAKNEELTGSQTKLESLENKCNKDLNEKDNAIGDVNTKLNALVEQNRKLESLNKENMKALNECKLNVENLNKQLSEQNVCNQTLLPQPISETNNGLESPNQVNNQPNRDPIVDFISSPTVLNEENENVEKKGIEKAVLPPNPQNETKFIISDTQDSGKNQAIITDLSSKPDSQKNASALGETAKKEDSLVDAGSPGVIDPMDDSK